MEQTDVNEIALMAHHAKESGLNRVEIDPSDLYELCSMIAGMREDLISWQKVDKMTTKKSTGLNWERVHERQRLNSKVYE